MHSFTINKYTDRVSSMHEKNIKQKTVKQLKKELSLLETTLSMRRRKGLPVMY